MHQFLLIDILCHVYAIISNTVFECHTTKITKTSYIQVLHKCVQHLKSSNRPSVICHLHLNHFQCHYLHNYGSLFKKQELQPNSITAVGAGCRSVQSIANSPLMMPLMGKLLGSSYRQLLQGAPRQLLGRRSCKGASRGVPRGALKEPLVGAPLTILGSSQGELLDNCWEILG